MNLNNVPRTAYVVLTLRNVGTPFPVVVSAGIYSSNSSGLTGAGKDLFYADLFHMEGEDYQQAHDDVVSYIKTAPHLAWLVPWVDKSEDAHMARYYWQVLPKREM